MTTEFQGDEDLVAYLDGELDETGIARVEAALERDPAVTARLQVLAEATTLVRSAFDEVLREPVPATLLVAASAGTNVVAFRPRVSRRWVGYALAASVCGIMFGGGVGYLAGSQGSSVLDNIAGSHNLLVASAEAGQTAAFDVPAGTEGALPSGIRVPDMTPWGLSFKGTRKIPADAGKVAYQFYFDSDKKDLGRITVTLWNSSRSDIQPTFERRDDVNMMYWRHTGHGIAIAGQANKGYMWNMAQDIAWQLNKV